MCLPNGRRKPNLFFWKFSPLPHIGLEICRMQLLTFASALGFGTLDNRQFTRCGKNIRAPPHLSPSSPSTIHNQRSPTLTSLPRSKGGGAQSSSLCKLNRDRDRGHVLNRLAIRPEEASLYLGSPRPLHHPRTDDVARSQTLAHQAPKIRGVGPPSSLIGRPLIKAPHQAHLA